MDHLYHAPTPVETISKTNEIVDYINSAIQAGGKKYATVVVGNGLRHAPSDAHHLYWPGGTGAGTFINTILRMNILDAGGKLVLLEGTYDIGLPIQLQRDDISLEGMGAGTILKVTATYPTTVIEMVGNNCKVSNLQIRGENADAKGIHIRSKNCTISDVAIKSLASGIIVDGTCNTVRSCTIDACRDIGIQIPNASRRHIISGNICSACNYGMDIYAGTQCVITNNLCLDNTTGIRLWGDSCYNNVTANNVMRGTGLSSDYTSVHNTIYLGRSASKNLIISNVISGKNVYIEAGSNNMIANNGF